MNIAQRISEILSPEQMTIIQKAAKEYGTDADLILAIGWHETNWGTAGDGLSGMYTGYGSYDSGSDYSLAGFESQVRGTARKMGTEGWGIPEGGVTLSKLKAGNAGLLPTNIYATDSNWPNAIYKIYQEISGKTGTLDFSGVLSGTVTGTGTGTVGGGGSFGGAGTGASWIAEKDRAKSVGYGIVFLLVSMAIGAAVISGGVK